MGKRIDTVHANPPPFIHPMNDRSARVLVCRGARATEQRLLAEIERARPRTPEQLGQPVRVVVPSRSLREHVSSRIVAEMGSVAGVVVQTTQRLAYEILTSAGFEEDSGDALFELLVRRFAPANAVLRNSLEGLQNGYDVLVGVVRDVLDAGFQAAHLEAIEERLSEIERNVGRQRCDRARALMGLAVAVGDGIRAAGRNRAADAPLRASELLRNTGPDLLPSMQLMIHGFADATGVTSDLIQTLVGVCGATIILDRPADPAGGEEDAGCVFLNRLDVRLGGAPKEQDPVTPASSDVRLVEAGKPEEESHWLAVELRRVLDQGASPEGILVVAKDLDSWALRLRRHFIRLGVPFSGIGATVPGGALRTRVSGLIELIQVAGRMETDRWIELAGQHRPNVRLVLGLRILGVLRLADLVGVNPEGEAPDGVVLPIGELSEEGERRGRRKLERKELEAVIQVASDALDVLDGWPAVAGVEEHTGRTRQLIRALEWDEVAGETEAAQRLVEELQAELPAEIEIDRAEWCRLLVTRERIQTNLPLGGFGGGVQVLSLTEARCRTADRLYVVGMVRGAFPRAMPDDPVLPDAVRVRLAADVLPEMPVKARSADEERYLFAQLLSCAPKVVLSWSRSVDGKRQAPSPFIDRIRIRRDLATVVAKEDLEHRLASVSRCAVHHGVHERSSRGRGVRFASVQQAIIEGRSIAGFSSGVDAEVVTQARLDVLDALEHPELRDDPEPWFGFVGSCGLPHTGSVAVTRLENIARCPWQFFVTRRLDVSPMPDPRRGLPEAEPNLLGSLVHRVLERIVLEAVGERSLDLEAVRSRTPKAISWPDEQTLARILEDVAGRIAAVAGLEVYGGGPLLSAMARPCLEVAERVVGPALGRVVGAEVKGIVPLPDSDLILSFRADRVDLVDEKLILVDYKTGAPVVEGAVLKPTMRKRIREGVASGKLLQGVAYAIGSETGCGQYVSLKPGLTSKSDEQRTVELEALDTELIQVFERALMVILNGAKAGVMVPRLEEPGSPGSQPGLCRACAVKDACIRSDTTLRRRLADWLNAEDDSRSVDRAGEPEARALWWLASGKAEMGA